MASQLYMQFVNRVRDANDIVSLIEEAGAKPRQVGRNELLCSSPFRRDSDPSMRIYTDQQKYYDFGESEGGDVIDFVQRWRGCSFNDAVDFLADRANIDWKSMGGGGGGRGLDEDTQREMDLLIERRRVVRISTECARYYHSRMTDEVAEWLLEKYGFDKEIIDKHLIGFADGTLMAAMKNRNKGYKTEHLLETGLFIKTSRGTIFEQHEHRVTFPYQRNGLCPYMISRKVPGITPDNEYQKAKYKKTLVYKDKNPYVSKHVKNDIFYGEDSIYKKRVKRLVITEGVTDAISAMACGFAVISPVTTRFRKADIDKAVELAEGADEVIIINDNEAPKEDPRTGRIVQPGLDGAVDMAHAFLVAGKPARIGVLPRPDDVDKVDINSIVAAGGKNILKGVVDSAVDFIQFLIFRLPEEVQPALLDETLSPIYEAIARCTNKVTQEAYIALLAKKYGLSAETIGESVREFAKAQGQQALPASPKVAADFMPDSSPSGGGSGGGGGGRGGGGGDDDGDGGDSDPPQGSGGSRRPPNNVKIKDLTQAGQWIAMNMKGAVLEDEEGFYYEQKRTRKDTIDIPINNFTLKANRVVIGDGGDKRYLHCDIYCSSTGKSYLNVAINIDLFETVRSFKVWLRANVSNSLTFSGGEANLEAILTRISRPDLPEVSGTSAVGYHRGPDGRAYFVGKDVVFDKDGIVEDPPIVFASDNPEGSQMANMLDLRGAWSDIDEIRKVAQKVMPKVFNLNEDGMLVPLIGWYGAAAVSPRIRERLNSFPHIECWGTAGSGKSSINRIVCLPVFAGYVGELPIAGDTPFARTKRLACSTSVPVVHDEFRGLSTSNEAAYNRKVRENYDGATEQRGRQNQTVVTYQNSAPMGTISESKSDDVALMERCICVSPMKSALTEGRRQMMDEIKSEDRSLLGGYFQRWCLGIDVDAYLARARRTLLGKLTALINQKLNPRVELNMLIMVAGYFIVKDWCSSMGVDMTDYPDLSKGFVQAVYNLTEREDGGPSKDAFDAFMERLSTMAIQRKLQEGVHYGFLDASSKLPDGMWLHLSTCHAEYLATQRLMGLTDDTQGINALKRIIREKEQDSTDYVVDRNRRVRCGPNSSYRRCVLLDPAAIPDFLDIEPFPRGENTDSQGWTSNVLPFRGHEM